ncbi:uncharacterized protein N7459_010115 [Penicillium hispanicum]|uniref:uncharacterized protein n=1 Tax=Penicillium hispanicum TaxID=1080232 RepID=UPI0025401130|nr:uncharacterized protein N7459_010115 [Penicillium hispanicum]KAJ5566733.1 hypothetical protein N7459_010115 [Penicillium hispanicum]
MASRREFNSSDESAYSGASSIARDARIARLYFEATELGLMPASTILQRSLSLKSVISTTSSFSRRFRSARFRPDLQKINQIGSGLQGAVFEVVGQALVIKKESPGNEALSSNLRHEFTIHCDVSAAFDQYENATHSHVHVPKPHEFISKTQNHTFWDEVVPKMPQAYRTRGDVVKMERILPLPKVVRKALITHFYGRDRNIDTSDIESFLNEPNNKHCLARVYLGQTVGPMNLDTSAPLRNLPLYLGFMEQLGLDTLTLANEMGKAYATLHWGAGVNGDDVEFVLGTSTAEAPRALVKPPDFQHRAVGLYLLDFGQCEAFDLTQDCDVVYQAFKGAMVTGDNQRFIPHYSRSPKLFAAFKKGYIEAGNAILSSKQLNEKFSMEDFMQEYEEYAEDFLY